MEVMHITAYNLAQRFIGLKEVSGGIDNPQVMAMLHLDEKWPEHDEVPWCSAFVNYIAWLLRLPRSKSLLARSWLTVGIPVQSMDAQVGFDIVVIKRGSGDQPGPENVTAPGHVGFYAGHQGINVMMLGGNQDNQVSLERYDSNRILGIRRLYA